MMVLLAAPGVLAEPDPSAPGDAPQAAAPAAEAPVPTAASDASTAVATGTQRYPCRSEDGLWGYIDATGAFVIPPTFLFANDFSEGLASVKMPDDKSAFIDPSGAVQFQGYSSMPFQGGVAMVVKFWVEEGSEDEFGHGIPHSLFGMMDRKGRIVGKVDYTNLGQMNEGLAVANRGGRFGFVDARGRQILPCKLPTPIGDLHDGLAWQKVKDEYGYIDRKGRQVIKPLYDEAEDFHEGFARVRVGNRLFFIGV